MKKKVKINSLFKGQKNVVPRTYIIAEIGINHQGSADRCADMIRKFAKAGADAIKLQTVDPAKCYAADTESFRIFSSSMLSQAETAKMFQIARDCGVEAFTTSGDLQTLQWINKLDPVAHKISSGLLSCTPMVKEVAKLAKPVIMSTGMSGIETIDDAVNLTKRFGCQTALLQCTAQYPCPIDKINLAVIKLLQNRFQLPTGLSDHSEGINIGPLAVAAGARIIEKHVTFDKRLPGFDHSISLVSDEFAQMVDLIRAAEAALGNSAKIVDDEMFKQAQSFERFLSTARNLEKGHALTLEDLLFMRFAKGSVGIPSRHTDNVISKKINKSLIAGQLISWKDLS